MSEALDTPSVFQTKLTFGWVGVTTCAYFIVFLLKRIELNHTHRRKRRVKLDDRIGRDTALSVSVSSNASASASVSVSNATHHTAELSASGSYDAVSGSGSGNVSGNNKKSSSSSSVSPSTTLDTPGDSSVFESQIHDMATNPKYFEPQSDDTYQYHNQNSDLDDLDNLDSPRIVRTKLHLEEKLQLYGLVSLLLFLTYLLLVYLPSGPIPSLTGTFLLSTVLLKSQVCDELRRGRYDRLCGIATLILYGAACLSLLTYANVGLKEGEIYEGRARIVGYDTSVYDTMDGEATRMDLEVAWGGDWGCPDYDGVQCQAFVNGALCESDEKDNYENRRHRHRQVQAQAQPTQHSPIHARQLTSEEGDDAFDLSEEEEEEIETQNSQSQNEDKDEDQNENEDENEKTIEQLEKEVEELTKENEQLTTENEQLDKVVLDENTKLNNEDQTIEVVAEAVEEEAEVAEFYKEEALDEESAAVEESVEIMEEENIAIYYEGVAEGEAEVIEEVYGEDEGSEIVEGIEDENLDYYLENQEVIEMVEEQEDEVVDEAFEEEAYYGDSDTEDIIEEAEKIIEQGFEDQDEINEEVEEIQESIENEKEDEGITTTVVDDDEYNEEIYEEEEEEEWEEEEEEEITAYYNTYSYAWDDDMFEDDWWSSSWSDVWGEYACNDLFDEDLDGRTYNINEKPGSDDWPFVNIYGSCNRCEAYLVDYYSTEHFNTIKNYQKHAKIYAGVGTVGLVMTLALAVKEWISPTQENELGLLMYDGGQMV